MSTITRISPAEAQEKLAQGYTYVDVRSEQEFAEGHPAGAVNVPLMHAGPGGMAPNPEFLTVMKALFPTDAKLVLGCRGGVRSLRAAMPSSPKGSPASSINAPGGKARKTPSVP